MKAYKQFLIEKLYNFFESIEQTLKSLIGYNDTTKPGKYVIRINDNFYDNDEKTDFDNPDFLDGYMLVNRDIDNDKITIIQKINITKIVNMTKLLEEEALEEIKDYINKALYYFDVLVGGQKGVNVGKGGYVRIIGHVAPQDFRGYYVIDKVIDEKIEIHGNDKYLVREILLKLIESTSYDIEPTGKVNIKKSKGISLGKATKTDKTDDLESNEPIEHEPTEKELAFAQKELEYVNDY